MPVRSSAVLLTRVSRVLLPALLVGLTACVFGCKPAEPSAATEVASTNTTPAEPAAETPPPAPKVTSFPDNWYFQDRAKGGRRPIPASLEGKPLPKLALTNWIGEPVDLTDLDGKIVVVDFWGTWCYPCMQAIPKNIKLVNDYEGRDVVFIGVHDANRGFESAGQAVVQHGINYPVAKDDARQSALAFKVRTWPSYFVADHHGIVRAAGLYPDRVADVVKILVDEREAGY